MCSAHTHQGKEGSGHSDRTHVHLSGHGHSHVNDHGGNATSHEHQTLDGSISSAEIDSKDPGNHDSDAIYFGDQNDLQFQSKLTIADTSTVPVVWWFTEWPKIVNPVHRSQVTRAGPFAQLQCALFLQTRCLLI